MNTRGTFLSVLIALVFLFASVHGYGKVFVDFITPVNGTSTFIEATNSDVLVAASANIGQIDAHNFNGFSVDTQGPVTFTSTGSHSIQVPTTATFEGNTGSFSSAADFSFTGTHVNADFGSASFSAANHVQFSSGNQAYIQGNDVALSSGGNVALSSTGGNLVLQSAQQTNLNSGSFSFTSTGDFHVDSALGNTLLSGIDSVSIDTNSLHAQSEVDFSLSSAGTLKISAEAHVRLQSAYFVTLTGYGGLALLANNGNLISRASTDASYLSGETSSYQATTAVNIFSYGDSASGIQFNANNGNLGLSSTQGNINLASSNNNVDLITANTTNIDGGSLIDFSGVTSGISIISSTFGVESTSFDFVSATRPFTSISDQDMVFTAGSTINVASQNAIDATSTNNILIQTASVISIDSLVSDLVQNNGDLPGGIEINAPTINFNAKQIFSQNSNSFFEVSTAVFSTEILVIGDNEEGITQIITNQNNDFTSQTDFQINSHALFINANQFTIPSSNAFLSWETSHGDLTLNALSGYSLSSGKSAIQLQAESQAILQSSSGVSTFSAASSTWTIGLQSQLFTESVTLKSPTASISSSFTNIYAPNSLEFITGGGFSNSIVNDASFSASSSFSQIAATSYSSSASLIAFVPNAASSFSFGASNIAFTIAKEIDFFSGNNLIVSGTVGTFSFTNDINIEGLDTLSVNSGPFTASAKSALSILSLGGITSSSQNTLIDSAAAFSNVQIQGFDQGSTVDFVTSGLTTFTSATFNALSYGDFDINANVFNVISATYSYTADQYQQYSSEITFTAGTTQSFLASGSIYLESVASVLFFDEQSTISAGGNGILTAPSQNFEAGTFSWSQGNDLIFFANSSFTSNSPNSLQLSGSTLFMEAAATVSMTSGQALDFEFTNIIVNSDQISFLASANSEIFSYDSDLDFISQQFTLFNIGSTGIYAEALGPATVSANETISYSGSSFLFFEDSPTAGNYLTLSSLHGVTNLAAQQNVIISTVATGVGPLTGDINFIQTGDFIATGQGFNINTFSILGSFTFPNLGTIPDVSILVQTAGNNGNIILESTSSSVSFTALNGAFLALGDHLINDAVGSISYSAGTVFVTSYENFFDTTNSQQITSSDFITYTANNNFNFDLAGAISMSIANPSLIDNPINFQASNLIRFASGSNTPITFNFLGINEQVFNYTGFAGGQLNVQLQGNLTSLSGNNLIFTTHQGPLTLSTSQATTFTNTGDLLVNAGGDSNVISAGNDNYNIGRNFILSTYGRLVIGSATNLETVFNVNGILSILSEGDRVSPQDGVVLSAPTFTSMNPHATTTLNAQAIVQLGSTDYNPSVTLTASGAVPVFQLTAEGTFTSTSQSLEFGTTNYELDVAKFTSFNYLENAQFSTAQTLAFNAKQGNVHLIGGDVNINSALENVLANKFIIGLNTQNTKDEILFNSNTATTTFNVQNVNSLANTWNINSAGTIVWNGKQSTVIKSVDSYSDSLYNWVVNNGPSVFQAGTGVSFTTTNYNGDILVNAISINIDDKFSSGSTITYTSAGNIQYSAPLGYVTVQADSGVEFHAGVEKTAQGLRADVTFAQSNTFTAQAASNIIANIQDEVNLSGWDQANQVSPTTTTYFDSVDTTFASANDMTFVSPLSTGTFNSVSAVTSTIQSNPGTNGTVSFESYGTTSISVATIATETVGENLINELTQFTVSSNAIDATGYGYGIRFQTANANGNIIFDGVQSINFNAGDSLDFIAATRNNVPSSVQFTSDSTEFQVANALSIYTSNANGDISFYNGAGTTTFASSDFQFFTTAGFISFNSNGFDSLSGTGILVNALNEVFIQAENLNIVAQKDFVVQSSNSDLPLEMGIFIGDLNTYLNTTSTASSTVQFTTTAPQADIKVEALSINIGASIFDQSSVARFSAIGNDDGSFVFQSEKNVKVFSIFNQQYFSNHPLADIEIATSGPGSDVNVRGTGVRFESLQRILVQTTSLTGTHVILGSKGGANIFQQTDSTQTYGVDIRALNGNFVADAGTSGDVDFVSQSNIYFSSSAGIQYNADNFQLSGHNVNLITNGGSFNILTNSLSLTAPTIDFISGYSTVNPTFQNTAFGAPGQDIFITSPAVGSDSWVATSTYLAALNTINIVSNESQISITQNLDASASNFLIPAYGSVLRNSAAQPCLNNAIAYHTSPYVAPKICACVTNGWLCYQFVQN